MRDPIDGLWMGEVQLVDARGMPVCVKRKGGFLKVKVLLRCDAVTKDEYVLWLPCHRARLFGVAFGAHVWHPVDPGSSLGRVTTLSLRYSHISLNTMN